MRLTRDGVTIPSGFIEDDRIIFATEDDYYSENDTEGNQTSLLPPKMIAQYKISDKSILHAAPLQEVVGIIYPFGPDHVISFYNYPKIIALATGETTARWEEFHTGEQTSCIVMNSSKFSPPIAIDPANKRFAIASDTEITVIQMGE